MIPTRLSVQIQKRLDAARAEVARLESALAVFHELGGAAGPNGKTRALDAAAAALTSSTPAANGHGDASAIPPALQRWRPERRDELAVEHRKRAAIAVVDALGAAATVDTAITMLRELGYARGAANMIAQSTRHKSIKRGRGDRLTLTPRGRALLDAVPAPAESAP